MVVVVVASTALARPASAQIECLLDPEDPACDSSTTMSTSSEEPTTTTDDVDGETTTTFRTTTTESLSRDGDETTTTGESTTTTSVPLLLEEGPPVAPGGVLPVQATSTSVAPAAGDGNDDTGRLVALVVTALLVLAVVFGLLTYWYWRRTRPGMKPAASGS